MPKYLAIMLNYAQVGYRSYYAQSYAGIMCQGLVECTLINCFVGSWTPFIIGQLYDDPPPSHSRQIAYKNFGCYIGNYQQMYILTLSS